MVRSSTIRASRATNKRHGVIKEPPPPQSSSSFFHEWYHKIGNKVQNNTWYHQLQNKNRSTCLTYMILLGISMLATVSLTLSVFVLHRQEVIHDLSPLRKSSSSKLMANSNSNSSSNNDSKGSTSNNTQFQITSSAFHYGHPIPSKYAGTVSPPLSWENVPNGTAGFVLVIEDPDAPDPAAPEIILRHWIIYNIPANVRSLEEGVHVLPEGSVVIINDFYNLHYNGPAPKFGEHRYYFRLYALNVSQITIKLSSTRTTPMYDDLYRLMKSHIIQEATLMGTYDSVHYD